MKARKSKPFDETDVMELVRLAAYLETRVGTGRFPKARFQRYSDTLDRLMRYMADMEDEE